MKNHIYSFILITLALSFLIVSCKKDNEDPPPPSTKTLTVNLGADRILQEGDSIILDAGNPGCAYLWSTGAVSQTIIADTTGNYWVKVTKGDSAGGDTVKIDLSYKLSKIETDFGTMLLWLYPQTPLHRNNFLKLTSDHFYDSVIFHRVINNFVIQGGDPTGTGSGGPGYTIPAEFRSTIKHVNGAVGAARLSDNINPNKESNGSQFYIVDNVNGTPTLDGRYTVFGIVIDGISTVDAISQVPTNLANDRPIDNVYMTKVTIVNYTSKELMDNFGFAIPK
jgi:cyclophilin family peptidyl-prolyl cis-trans isomerase